MAGIVRCLKCGHEGNVLIRVLPGCFGIMIILLSYFSGFIILFLEMDSSNKVVLASIFWIVFLYFITRSFKAICPECRAVLSSIDSR